jgi:hypothetical protein
MSNVSTDSKDTLNDNDPGAIKIGRSLDFQLMSYIDPFLRTQFIAPHSLLGRTPGELGNYIL